MPDRIHVRDLPRTHDAVRVDRATMWGNPFRSDAPTREMIAAGAYSAADAFRLWLDGHPALAVIEPERRKAILSLIGTLHGKRLACWCPPGAECHADVLLARAAAAEPVAENPLGVPVSLPRVALSVRQPWAWAIIHGGKDIENRTDGSVRAGRMRAMIGERIAIHAAKGMTREEYEDAAEFMDSIGVECPPAADLERGGVIGSARLLGIVEQTDSKWFFGPRGLVLAEAAPCPFVGASGELGMFSWSPNLARQQPPMKWMAPTSGDVGGLFGE